MSPLAFLGAEYEVHPVLSVGMGHEFPSCVVPTGLAFVSLSITQHFRAGLPYLVPSGLLFSRNLGGILPATFRHPTFAQTLVSARTPVC